MGNGTAELRSIREDLDQVRAWLLDYSHALAELYAHAEEVGESLTATGKQLDAAAQHFDGKAGIAAAAARTLEEEALRLSASRNHLNDILESLSQRVSSLEASLTAQVADAVGSLQQASKESAACSKEEFRATREHVDALHHLVQDGLANAQAVLDKVRDECQQIQGGQEQQQQRMAKQREELWTRLDLLERRLKAAMLWLAVAATAVVGGLAVAGSLWPMR